MLLIFNLFSLFLCVFTFTFPFCYDRVISDLNINQEFLIDNVDGIGEVGITSDFKCSIASELGSLICGYAIYDKFAKYAKSKLNLNSQQIFKLNSAMKRYNEKTENLIPISKLMFGV